MSSSTICGRYAVGTLIQPNPEYRQGCDPSIPDKLEQKVHGEVVHVFADSLSVYLLGRDRKLVKVPFHALVFDAPKSVAAPHCDPYIVPENPKS